MDRVSRITLGLFALAAVLAAAYAALIFWYWPRSAPKDFVADGAVPSNLRVSGNIGPVVYEEGDLDGDGRNEVLEGYAVAGSRGLGSTRPRPHLRVFAGGTVIGEFDFFIDSGVYANAEEWRLLYGVPGLERQDIDVDGRDEILVRSNSGGADYRALGILAWREGAVRWLPLFNSDRHPLLPIFREGGTPAESWRLLFLDADEIPGLEIVAARGFVDPQTGMEQWVYAVYAQNQDAYYFSAELSERVAGELGGGVAENG